MTRPAFTRRPARTGRAGERVKIAGRYRLVAVAGRAPGARGTYAATSPVVLVTEDGRGVELGAGAIVRIRPAERTPAR